MRIACLHVPQFALQCASRIDPSLRGAPVAIAGLPLVPVRGVTVQAPVVQACSRAAWALGCRVGMTVTAARALSPALCVVTADSRVERETIRALADVVASVAPQVELGARVGAGGAHLAMYCEVPAKMRGTSFGDRVVMLLEQVGIVARVGIADDRFTAWVAASERTTSDGDPEADVVSVPRGGSAAYLAPRPLSLLAITSEVQHMLEALGIETLGQFAALPAPSVARPFEADFQGLARGDSGHSLKAYAPEAPIREEHLCSDAPGMSPSAAIAVLAERIALRLAGRARGAARLEVTATVGGDAHVHVVDARTQKRGLFAEGVAIDAPELLAESISVGLGEDLHAATRVVVAVVGEAVTTEAVAVATPTAFSISAVAPAPVSRAAEPRTDILAVVLASTGQQSREPAFGLTSPAGTGALRAEHRATHHRTQRGKQRRRDRVAESLAQPRLFKL